VAIKWDRDPKQVFQKGVDNYRRQLYQALVQVLKEWAPQVQRYAQQNAPWQDVTGAARAKLTAYVEQPPSTGSGAANLKLHLVHGVDYGVWLELRWGGKYAIIWPTIQVFGPMIMADVRWRMRR